MTGMTGPVVIDYKGDRIMDYQVWYLASDSDKFKGYMKIPLMKAWRNVTVCREWLVRTSYCLGWQYTLYSQLYALLSY